MVNILTHWNGFVHRKKTAPLATGELALYYVLMEYWNGLGRAEWFCVAAGVLQGLAGLSESGFKRARTQLCRKGYICYRQGTGRAAARYHLPDFSAGREDLGGKVNHKVDRKVDRKLDPLKKEKEKEKENQHPLAGVLKTVEWQNYAQMRVKMHKPLEPRAVWMALDKLLELAGGDAGRQRRILDQSTFYCWKDLYPLERRGGGRLVVETQGPAAALDMDELARRAAEQRAEKRRARKSDCPAAIPFDSSA